MTYIQETVNTILGKKYDVVVVGGGPGGCCAAIASARAGAKTLLVEQMGCFGGMWTNGLVNPIYDYKNKTGLVKEIIDKLSKRQGFGGFIGSCYDIEDMKSLLDELLINAGVDLLANTFATSVLKSDNKIEGVVVENKSGRTAYPASVVIDCTGDADICARGGVQTVLGDEESGEVQSFTLMYQLGNVHFHQTDPYALTKLIEQTNARTGRTYQIPFTRSFIIQQPTDNQAVVMLTHIRNLDPLCEKDRTAAMIEGRRQAREMFLYFKENIPEFKNLTFIQTAPSLGVRESRRLVGLHTITINDCLQGIIPDDSVTVATFNVDIHNQKDKDQAYFNVRPYGIPYRSMVPVKIDGLLVAGRCISGTHEAMASYRVTGNCAAMGQAAGCAAALCSKMGCQPRQLPFEKLKAVLIAQGVKFPMPL